MCNANGPSTPGLQQSLAMTRLPVLPSSMHKPWAGSESYKISGLNTIHGWTASPVHSSSLPFCVRFNAAVARRAATLDTGPVASSYPRGVPPACQQTISSPHVQTFPITRAARVIQPLSRTSPPPRVHRMVTICPRPSAGSWLPHRRGSPRNGQCSPNSIPRMDTDQHGSQDDLHRPPVRIHSLRDKRSNAAIERPRGPASVRAGVHGSPCGFWLFVNVQHYAPGAQHAESVNSS
jgi:hypothetical protein